MVMHAESTYTLNEAFDFITEQGERLPTEVLTASVYEEGSIQGQLAQCLMTVRVVPGVYTRIDTQAMFQLDPSQRLPTSVEFDPEKPVLLDLVLDAEGLRSLIVEGAPNAADDVVNRLFAWSRSVAPELIGCPALSTEHWYALHVKQAVELPDYLQADGHELFEGYSTRWAEGQDHNG
ncbi:hypothetical protein [Leptothrix ochracea]|uniref:hypothetical protein n=1 Tax=Leptothrix ochracea TaxID=735331 RepID=UPI0034E1A9A0